MNTTQSEQTTTQQSITYNAALEKFLFAYAEYQQDVGQDRAFETICTWLVGDCIDLKRNRMSTIWNNEMEVDINITFSGSHGELLTSEIEEKKQHVTQQVQALTQELAKSGASLPELFKVQPIAEKFLNSIEHERKQSLIKKAMGVFKDGDLKIMVNNRLSEWVGYK